MTLTSEGEFDKSSLLRECKGLISEYEQRRASRSRRTGWGRVEESRYAPSVEWERDELEARLSELAAPNLPSRGYGSFPPPAASPQHSHFRETRGWSPPREALSSTRRSLSPPKWNPGLMHSTAITEAATRELVEAEARAAVAVMRVAEEHALREKLEARLHSFQLRDSNVESEQLDEARREKIELVALMAEVQARAESKEAALSGLVEQNRATTMALEAKVTRLEERLMHQAQEGEGHFKVRAELEAQLIEQLELVEQERSTVAVLRRDNAWLKAELQATQIGIEMEHHVDPCSPSHPFPSTGPHAGPRSSRPSSPGAPDSPRSPRSPRHGSGPYRTDSPGHSSSVPIGNGNTVEQQQALHSTLLGLEAPQPGTGELQLQPPELRRYHPSQSSQHEHGYATPHALAHTNTHVPTHRRTHAPTQTPPHAHMGSAHMPTQAHTQQGPAHAPTHTEAEVQGGRLQVHGAHIGGLYG